MVVLLPDDVTVETAREFVRRGFEERGTSTVLWRAARGDWDARRVAWTLGFTVDAVVPEPQTGAAQWVGHLDAADWTGHAAHPWWEPATLTGDRVRLRPWRDSDAVPTADAASRLLVTDMWPTAAAYPSWLQRRRERMADGQGVFWCVADESTDRVLGHLQVHRLDIDMTRGNGEVGYWLAADARGRGVLREALELVRRHAFAPRATASGADGLGLHRLQAGTDVANTPSARVLRRAGFRCWGVEQSVLSHADRPSSDALNWELLATDDMQAQRISPLVTPPFELDGVRLRPWRDDDGARLPDIADQLARRYLPARAQVTSATYPAWLARQRRFADEGVCVPWCIAEPDTDEPLGSVSIFRIGQATATSGEVGYWLLPRGRGQGLLPAALEAVVSYAFSPQDAGGLGLTRLSAETDRDNYASRAALRGAGFRQWGEDRQAYTAADGRITDGAYFELLSSDDREAQRAVKPPVLDFPEVRLRPLRRDDVGCLAATWAEPDVQHWLSVPGQDLRERAASYIAQRRCADYGTHGSWWVVCAPGSEAFCGVVGLQNFDAGSAEVSYWLAGAARGGGLATAAVDAVGRYAFMPAASGGLGLRRLRVGIAQDNTASRGVALRAGFEQYGTAHRAETLGDGSVTDLLLFERLAAGGTGA